MGKGSRKHRSANNNRKRKENNVITFPSEGPMPMHLNDPVNAELERIYGKVYPENDNGIQRVIDLLGRVEGKTFPDDDIPDFLKAPVVTEKKPASERSRRVSIFKDHTLDYPALALKVFVAPDPQVHDDEARFAKMFVRASCRRAMSLGEADLVVFAGGADVDPLLYNEKPHYQTHTSPDRDQKDMDLYLFCLENGIPMFGVCRGAQFLHVMNGGKLWQHVDNHYGPHPMFDIINKQKIEKVSSVHHQMVRENIKGGMEIIATSARSNVRYANGKDEPDRGNNADIEAFYYRETGCFGVQGHPEYEGYNFYTIWCLKMIEATIILNPDFAYVDGFLRMTQEARDANKLANLPKPVEQPLLLPDNPKEN